MRFFPIGLLLIFVSPANSADSAENPLRDLRIETGRNFGLVLGDLIRHEIHFGLDKPYRLQKNSLPWHGPLGEWLELREIDIAETDHENRTLYRLDILYQIFPAVREYESRQIPGLPLRIMSGGERLDSVTPETEVAITPLIPARTPDADVKIRPPIEPASIPLHAHRRTIATLGATILLILGYLAWRKDLLPFLQSPKSPFAAARSEIAKARRAGPDSPEYRNALLAIHRALNKTAGEIVFASGLEPFFRNHPAFAPMREKTGVFFRLSHEIFFTPTPNVEYADYNVRWLEQFCKEYHDIERGA